MVAADAEEGIPRGPGLEVFVRLPVVTADAEESIARGSGLEVLVHIPVVAADAEKSVAGSPGFEVFVHIPVVAADAKESVARGLETDTEQQRCGHQLPSQRHRRARRYRRAAEGADGLSRLLAFRTRVVVGMLMMRQSVMHVGHGGALGRVPACLLCGRRGSWERQEQALVISVGKAQKQHADHRGH
jgi:hypothetical protein